MSSVTTSSRSIFPLIPDLTHILKTLASKTTTSKIKATFASRQNNISVIIKLVDLPLSSWIMTVVDPLTIIAAGDDVVIIIMNVCSPS